MDELAALHRVSWASETADGQGRPGFPLGTGPGSLQPVCLPMPVVCPHRSPWWDPLHRTQRSRFCQRRPRGCTTPEDTVTNLALQSWLGYSAAKALLSAGGHEPFCRLRCPSPAPWLSYQCKHSTRILQGEALRLHMTTLTCRWYYLSKQAPLFSGLPFHEGGRQVVQPASTAVLYNVYPIVTFARIFPLLRTNVSHCAPNNVHHQLIAQANGFVEHQASGALAGLALPRRGGLLIDVAKGIYPSFQAIPAIYRGVHSSLGRRKPAKESPACTAKATRSLCTTWRTRPLPKPTSLHKAVTSLFPPDKGRAFPPEYPASQRQGTARSGRGSRQLASDWSREGPTACTFVRSGTSQLVLASTPQGGHLSSRTRAQLPTLTVSRWMLFVKRRLDDDSDESTTASSRRLLLSEAEGHKCGRARGLETDRRERLRTCLLHARPHGPWPGTAEKGRGWTKTHALLRRPHPRPALGGHLTIGPTEGNLPWHVNPATPAPGTGWSQGEEHPQARLSRCVLHSFSGGLRGGRLLAALRAATVGVLSSENGTGDFSLPRGKQPDLCTEEEASLQIQP
eukprot:scaffold1190_cov393-Prasinococcus_capsulatus_cf.AAC.16